MSERARNFLANWIDANLLHAGEAQERDQAILETHYLTDVVAAGVTLDEVRADWAEVERAISAALNRTPAIP